MHLKLTNGTPAKYTLGQLRRDNPNTSFPKQIPDKLLASYDVYPYTRPSSPEYDRLSHQLTDGAFEQVAGAWSLPYVVEQQPLEQAERNVRSHRNDLMQKTDWWVVADRVTTDAEIAYRQALRDIPQQTGFPDNVAWPINPLEATP